MRYYTTFSSALLIFYYTKGPLALSPHRRRPYVFPGPLPGGPARYARPPADLGLPTLGPKNDINVRSLQKMVSGIPLILGQSLWIEQAWAEACRSEGSGSKGGKAFGSHCDGRLLCALRVEILNFQGYPSWDLQGLVSTLPTLLTLLRVRWALTSDIE